MAKPDILLIGLLIGGHTYCWQKICELRRRQLAALKAARGEQPTLFALNDDCRPVAERTATGRYQEPTLLGLMRDD
jgi:hypothetical protein